MRLKLWVSSSEGDDLDLFLALRKLLRPLRSHTRIQKLHPSDIVSVEIEIWPSATLFESGTSLQLTIQGHDAAKYPVFRHTKLANRRWHTIFTGGRYDSCLTVPLKNRSNELTSSSACSRYSTLDEKSSMLRSGFERDPIPGIRLLECAASLCSQHRRTQGGRWTRKNT